MEPARANSTRARKSSSMLPTMSRIVPGGQYHADHYEAAELSVLRHKRVAGDVHENDSNEKACVRGRDGGGGGPCSPARADPTSGPGPGGGGAVPHIPPPGAGPGAGEIQLEAR